jgi:hypothetical protein
VTVTLLIICSLFVSGCREDVHSKYATLHELERAGPGARTWFPEILPASAFDLEVWYDIDTSDTVGRLRFDPSELEPLRRRLATQLRGEPLARADLPTMDVVDWPRCLKGSMTAAEIRACGYEAIRIREFQMAIDPRGAAYFWTP